MTIKNKGFEYNLTNEEKEAFQAVFNVLDQLYRDDYIEEDVNNKMIIQNPILSDFRINKFLGQFCLLGLRLFNLDFGEERDDE